MTTDTEARFDLMLLMRYIQMSNDSSFYTLSNVGVLPNEKPNQASPLIYVNSLKYNFQRSFTMLAPPSVLFSLIASRRSSRNSNVAYDYWCPDQSLSLQGVNNWDTELLTGNRSL